MNSSYKKMLFAVILVLCISTAQSACHKKCEQVTKFVNGTRVCSCRPGYVVDSVDRFKCIQYQPSILGTFFQLLSGTFSNSGDPGRLDPECPQDLIEAEFLPLHIESLENFTGGYTILFTERVNGAIYRLEVLTVKMDAHRPIRIQPYNITDNTVVQGGQVNLTLLSALGVRSFQTRNECEIIYRAIESNTFVAAWPDCTGYNGGELATYTITLSCNALSFVSVLNLFHEKACNSPYIIWLKERFPLPPNMIYNNHGGGDPCNCPAS